MDKSKMLGRLRKQTAEQTEKLKHDVAKALEKNANDATAKEWLVVLAEFEGGEESLPDHGLEWRKKGQQHYRYGNHEGREVVSIQKLQNHTSDIKEVWQVNVLGKPIQGIFHRIEVAREAGAKEFFKDK